MYLTIGYMFQMETKILSKDVIASGNASLGTF
jgi:hypothetical protein